MMRTATWSNRRSRDSSAYWALVSSPVPPMISPYLFFWQASQEVEDTKTEPVREPLRRQPEQGADALARIRLDTLIGMGVSNPVALAIMATSAATLHTAHIDTVESAASHRRAAPYSPSCIAIRFRRPGADPI